MFLVEALSAFIGLCVAPALGAVAGFLMGLQRFLSVILRELYGWNKPILLKDAVVILTGAAGGFGTEVTKKLIENGAVVYALDVVSTEVAAAKLPLGTDRCIYRQIDITDDKQLEKFVKELQKKNVQVYGLVNNAGITGTPSAAAQTSADSSRRVLDVNFFAAVELTRLLFDIRNPLFKFNSQRCVAGRAPTRSRVVNITSVAGLVSAGGLSNYCASKTALEFFSDSTRIECSDKYIDVAIVEPYFATSGIYRSIVSDDVNFEGSILKDNFVSSQAKFKQALAQNTLMTAEYVAGFIVKALTDAVPQDRYCVSPAAREAGIRLAIHFPNHLFLMDKIKIWSSKQDRV